MSLRDLDAELGSITVCLDSDGKVRSAEDFDADVVQHLRPWRESS